MHSVIVENVEKSYDGVKAVKGVSFRVRKGEIFGLLGPNGAGKTTLTSILTTLLKADSGYAEVAGFSVEEKLRVRERIGVVFQEPALDTRLTARENLEFHAMLYGMPKSVRTERIERSLELVGLKDWANTLVEKFSGGMKRRLEMGRAFIHQPEVLFLDEPTLGLDVQARRSIWEYVRMLRDEGVTIFMTTHYIEEAEKLCDTVAIMDRGKIVRIGSVDELKRELGEDTIYVELSEKPEDREIEQVKEIDGVKDVVVSDTTLMILASNGDRIVPRLFSIFAEGKVKAVSMKTPDLEDVFVRLTGRRIGGG